ncbi:glycosyltransferase family 2 protein [Candidatus Uhrbacteria bacterium]|nr:glycosyltransferase family 2 protein [Candidatus Uhrbacteria bacterium]
MIVAVIPAFNEEREVGNVVKNTLPFVDRVLVVDDGSSDGTASVARAAGAVVVQHVINRGLGASLGTGIKSARKIGGTKIITLDADGQHAADEIPLFVEALDSHEVVLGSRMIEMKGNMPAFRKVAQRVGNGLTYVMFGLMVSDSQSGFRGFSAKAADALEIKTDRMEVSSEIISEIQKSGFSWTEVPITAIYTEYSLSKGQSFTVGIKTALKLFVHRIKS